MKAGWSSTQKSTWSAMGSSPKSLRRWPLRVKGARLPRAPCGTPSYTSVRVSGFVRPKPCGAAYGVVKHDCWQVAGRAMDSDSVYTAGLKRLRQNMSDAHFQGDSASALCKA
jgi:hypothetical protein